ncbi:electron transfer flavoprotein subunit alpha/FixB family protein [Natrialbaceae archaeon GCM10025810]|uniref:electron transfer flavoprotein subunit alpha/FixB family protein n=1 Tax=Halovalidus salilacus TaxID=3075124 RepID=UPI0036187AE2
MTGPIWAIPTAADDPIIHEADRLANRLEDEGVVEDRPRVTALWFEGAGESLDLESTTARVDELVRLVREDGSFRSGSAGIRSRAKALRSLARQDEQPMAVVLPSTPDGDDLAAAAATELRGGCVTDCLLRIRDGELRAGRPAYEDRAYAGISFDRGVPVVSLNVDVLGRPTERTSADAPPERIHRVRLEDADEGDGEGAIRRVDVLEVPERDLSRTNRIVAGGYGLDGPDGFDVIDDLADAVAASIGASRPPADEGWVPYDRQIGVTGKEIDVDLYVPCAISGDPYHMRSVNADHLIPINSDPDATIFNAADLGVVGDVFEYGPVIAEAIRDASEKAVETEEVTR